MLPTAVHTECRLSQHGWSTVLHYTGLVNAVGPLTPRLLINKTYAGVFQNLDPEQNQNVEPGDCHYRDAVFAGGCDEGVAELAAQLGWGDELNAMAGLKQVDPT